MDLSAEEMGTLAYAEPPISPEGVARSLLIITITILTISTIVFAPRVWVRSWMLRASKGWGVDDTLAVLGFIPFILFSIFTIHGVYYGIGTPDSKLNRGLTMRGTEYMFYCQLTIAISVPFTKASIAIAVMRITSRRRYRYPLWAIIGISAASCIAGVVGLLITCRPLAAKWNSALGSCNDHLNRIIYLASLAFSYVAIVTDLACAVVPFMIVRNLQMRRRTKYSLVLILGFGIFASIACILRIPYFGYYNRTDDVLYGTGYIILWSAVESGVGIVAGSLPSLRALFGFYSESRDSSKGPFVVGGAGAPGTIGGTPFSVSGARVQLETLTPKDRGHSTASVERVDIGWDELGDDRSSRGIVLHNSVRVERQSGSLSEG